MSQHARPRQFAMGDFAKLQVWRKAHALALNVHRVAIGIRGSSYAALRSQLIRSAMSIPTNIVEGRNQKSDPQFARFLGYAINSSWELEYHLVVARDANVVSVGDSRSLTDQNIEVRKMLYGLLKTVTESEPEPAPASTE